jgi:predicted helicase
LFWGEADAANQIKEVAPVMVILGNPPYSGHSANNSEWIKNLLKGKDTVTNQQTISKQVVTLKLMANPWAKETLSG